MQFKVFISSSTDPFVNLTYENSLLTMIQKDDAWLFLYKNTPSIVMGRFQNPWIECDFKNILEDRIHLVRRQSGGGTVYHDLGNLNFCFLHGTRDHKKDINHKIIINALKHFQIDSFSTDRSDLKVDFDGLKKISGSAFKQKKDKSFHHGTLLIDANLGKLNNYLKSPHTGSVSKGTKSNPSKVVNLKSLNENICEENLKESIIKSFFTFYEDKTLAIETVQENIVLDEQYLKHLKSNSWVMDETPYCELVIEQAKNKVIIQAKKGTIIDVELDLTFLDGFDLTLVSRTMENKKLTKHSLDLIISDLSSLGLDSSSVQKFKDFLNSGEIFY